MTNNYPVNRLYIKTYVNKKGVKKIGINLDDELAKKLSNWDQIVIDAIIFELKQDLEKL